MISSMTNRSCYKETILLSFFNCSYLLGVICLVDFCWLGDLLSLLLSTRLPLLGVTFKGWAKVLVFVRVRFCVFLADRTPADGDFEIFLYFYVLCGETLATLFSIFYYLLLRASINRSSLPFSTISFLSLKISFWYRVSFLSRFVGFYS